MSISQSEKIMKYTITIVNVILVTLTILGVVKTCFVGFDVDEAYAVAQSYRLAVGDHMFSEMWEPHQMSAFGSAIFMLPFLLITGGNTTGVILYLRIVGSVIHLLLGWWFYRTTARRYGTTIGLLIMFAHVNFLPKWLVLPEFEVMQYWAVCILFLAFLTWKEKAGVLITGADLADKAKEKSGKKFLRWDKTDGWLILAGAALFMAMMTYPTMILLYPLYVLFFFLQKEMKGKEKWRSVFVFTGTVFIIGVAFLLYLGSYMSVEEFIKNVSYIFMDASHSESLAVRGRRYMDEFLRLGTSMPMYLLWTAIIGAVICGVEFLIKCIKKSDSVQENKTNKRCAAIVIKYVLIFMISFLVVIIGSHIWGSLLEDQNQFYLYFRFLFVTLLGMVCFFILPGGNKDYFILGILPGIAGFVASSLVTNMSIEIAMARMYITVLATFMMVAELVKEKYKKDVVIKVISYGAIIAFIIGLIVSKVILVRVTGCLPVTLRMDMEWVKEGPATGLLVEDEFAWQYNDNIPLIRESVADGDKLLYIGCENIYYMVSEATIATPSVQGTTVFNEMFVCYYEEHPERIPNVVIIDKTFIDNPRYQYKQENQFILDWIAEEFQGAQVTETEYLIILRQ